MRGSGSSRHGVLVSIGWLIKDHPSNAAAGLACHRRSKGPEGLFSVFVKFIAADSAEKGWRLAKFFALSEDMDYRLSLADSALIVTSGLSAIAEAEVLSEFYEQI